MTMIHQDYDTPEFALKFGDMRKLLTRLEMGSEASIASRFRKLRPKFALDNLLSKRGNWLDYDLARVLSICAIYSVNSVSVPQGDAVPIIIRNWPEIARASLAANQAIIDGSEPSDEELVRIYVDAFPLDDAMGSTWAMAAKAPLIGLPHIVLDCRAIVAALVEMRPGDDSLQAAFGMIERTFGWEKLRADEEPRLPSRLESGFFGTGPYFVRARALISVTDAGFVRRRERLRLQSYLDYLEAPPPIDAWKMFIGTDEGKPRLHHMLSGWGIELGLKSNLLASHTLRSAAFPINDRALDLIERGQRHLATLVEADGRL